MQRIVLLYLTLFSPPPFSTLGHVSGWIGRIERIDMLWCVDVSPKSTRRSRPFFCRLTRFFPLSDPPLPLPSSPPAGLLAARRRETKKKREKKGGREGKGRRGSKKVPL